MTGILAPLLVGLRRRKTASSRKRADGSSDAGPRRVARRLADAIDRAMAMGLWEHADRLAAISAKLAPGYARLAEPLARLRLAQGEPETALGIIDGCRAHPASLRLLRATCLLLVGARSQAQIDLRRWSSKSSAPLDARLLLGLLEWKDDPESAVQTLLANLKHLEDPRTLQALLLVSVSRGRTEQAEFWAGRLRGCGAAGNGIPDVGLMLESLGMPGVQPDAESTPEQVNALAMELLTFEPAIGALTEAQRRRPHLPTARLIRSAIGQALPDLCDAPAALEALALLSLVLGDDEAADAFARRGLADNPMSASLALLLEELHGAEPRPSSPTLDPVIGAIGTTPAREKGKAA